MMKPDYIPTAAAQRMRFVDSVADVLKANLFTHEVAFFSRRVIGDFAALSRWMDQRFGIEHNELCVELGLRDLQNELESMNGGEQFAADQILKDMEEIQNLSNASDVPKLIVMCREAELDFEHGEHGIVKSCYHGAIVTGFRLTDMWRQATAECAVVEFDPCSQKPADGARPRLVLVA